MPVRLKGFLICFANFFVWMVIFFWAMRRAELSGGGDYVFLAILLAFLVLANLSLHFAVKVVRCPACGARFGWQNFSSQPWPFRHCMKCRVDLDRASERPPNPKAN